MKRSVKLLIAAIGCLFLFISAFELGEDYEYIRLKRAGEVWFKARGMMCYAVDDTRANSILVPKTTK